MEYVGERILAANTSDEAETIFVLGLTNPKASSRKKTAGLRFKRCLKGIINSFECMRAYQL